MDLVGFTRDDQVKFSARLNALFMLAICGALCKCVLSILLLHVANYTWAPMSNLDHMTSIVTFSDDVLSAAFGEDEDVLLDITSGTYFSLEGTGAFLWETWRDDGSVERSIERLVAVYAVDRATAEVDVMALIDDLVGRGLISVSDGKRDSAAT